MGPGLAPGIVGLAVSFGSVVAVCVVRAPVSFPAVSPVVPAFSALVVVAPVSVGSPG